MVALTSNRWGGVPAPLRLCARAIAKQLACAAASSSSGLVRPPGAAVRDAQLTGKSVNNRLVLALTTPEPEVRSPSHVASARRTAAIVFLLSTRCLMDRRRVLTLPPRAEPVPPS